ncbi:hypothetical protein llap_16099 [Limosa lapponica baueri]|uniref:REKLES domain-containing protein n=1 Tax=Limosa lapponica baueri TaxID=1758121 RepID=A0A2I0TIG0_LIMLA|nr:hypothetical protein llap_16099 [Limosa lapponica baueri]
MFPLLFVRVAVLEQLQEKLEVGEPLEKKVALMAEEQQQLVQHTVQHNLLAMASQFPVDLEISKQGAQHGARHLSPVGSDGSCPSFVPLQVLDKLVKEQRQDLTDGVKTLLKDYNKMVQTLLLSKQFIQWNEIPMQLEMAKEAKPVTE